MRIEVTSKQDTVKQIGKFVLDLADCRNEFGNDDACDAWNSQGECDNSKTWMTAFCRESCYSCKHSGSILSDEMSLLILYIIYK